MQSQSADDGRGRRSEDVAVWYFRLNGFLTIPGFIVHPDERRLRPHTEADLLGVRFPFSRERLARQEMQDHSLLTGIDNKGGRPVFILVEVKADLCNINGPWSEREQANMQRVIRRLGFVDDQSVDAIANDMYNSARWEDDDFVLQYVCVGDRKNDGRQRQFHNLLQIDWGEIAQFLWSRFSDFPEKLPDGGPVHEQWPDFGRAYGEWFQLQSGQSSRTGNDGKRQIAVQRYIKRGTCS